MTRYPPRTQKRLRHDTLAAHDAGLPEDRSAVLPMAAGIGEETSSSHMPWKERPPTPSTPLY
jgi:hypothetical protein